MYFKGLHPVSLIEVFIHKVIFPPVDADWTVFENESISLLQDLPGCNNEDFHEEATIEVMFGYLQHLKERNSILPLDSNFLPTASCKGACEE